MRGFGIAISESSVVTIPIDVSAPDQRLTNSWLPARCKPERHRLMVSMMYLSVLHMMTPISRLH